MGLKDWIAPFITLLIGASTIFISYKNYQAQAAAKPSELARLELWSKLLTEAGLDLNALPDPEKLTSDQRVVLENYRVFLKRASLESKLRKVGIDSNRIFSLLMKRAHSSVKPTPIPIGDSVRYYRLILRGLLYIWVPLAVVFIGVPIIVVTIVYLIGLFTNHRGNLSDFALSPLAVVLLIVGAVAVGSLVYLQNRIIPPLSRTTCTSTSGIFTAPRRAPAIPRKLTASAWRLKPTPTSCSSVSRSSPTSSAENMYNGGYSGD